MLVLPMPTEPAVNGVATTPRKIPMLGDVRDCVRRPPTGSGPTASPADNAEVVANTDASTRPPTATFTRCPGIADFIATPQIEFDGAVTGLLTTTLNGQFFSSKFVSEFTFVRVFVSYRSNITRSPSETAVPAIGVTYTTAGLRPPRFPVGTSTFIGSCSCCLTCS